MAIPFRIIWGTTSENPCGGGGKINVKKNPSGMGRGSNLQF